MRAAMQKRMFAILICAVFFAVSFFSMEYIAVETGHHCTGEHCPVCANVHAAEQTVRQLADGLVLAGSLYFVISSVFSMKAGVRFLISCQTPVKLKIRMNN